MDVFAPQFLTRVKAKINATLSARSGDESYSTQGSLADGSLALNLQFSGSPISRMGPSAVKGSLSGTGIRLAGRRRSRWLDLTVTLKDGRLGTDNLALSGQATFASGTIKAWALSVTYLSHRLTEGTGDVDLQSGTYSFNARYQGEYLADPIRMNAGLNGQFVPSRMDSLSSGLLDHGLRGRLSLSNIVVGKAYFPPWTVAFGTDHGRLSLDGGPGDSIHGWIDTQRSFSLSLASPLPIIAGIKGQIVGDHITTTVDVTSLDMQVLNEVLKSPPIPTSAGPLPVLRVTSGVASGRLLIEGPLGDPDYSGQLEIVGGGVTTAYSPDEAGPITTTLVFEGKTFHSTKVVAAAGPRASERGDALHHRPLGPAGVRHLPCHRRTGADAPARPVRQAECRRIGNRTDQDRRRRSENEHHGKLPHERLPDHPRAVDRREIRSRGSAHLRHARHPDGQARRVLLADGESPRSANHGEPRGHPGRHVPRRHGSLHREGQQVNQDATKGRRYISLGELGLGVTASPLRPGVDCPMNCSVFDAVVAESSGEPRIIPGAVALYERDAGIAWKHGENTRRARELVLSYFSQPGNYEYGFDWVFHQDGTLEMPAGSRPTATPHLALRASRRRP